MSRSGPNLLESLHDYGVQLRRRRVFLQSALLPGDRPGHGAAEQVIRNLLHLDETAGMIELWVCSPGGLISDMFAVHDVVRGLDNEVRTVAAGEVCSAAGLLLACGDQRAALPNAWYMAHDLQLDEVGDLPTVEARVDAARRMEERFCRLLGSYTRPRGTPRRGRTARWWSQALRSHRELWLDARGMYQHGLVDAVLGEPGE